MLVSVKNILDYLKDIEEEYIFYGDEKATIEGYSSLGNYKEGSITWIKKSENIPSGLDTSIIKLAIVQKGEDVVTDNKIICNNSKKCFFSIIEKLFINETREIESVGKGTYISPDVKLGKNVVIGHNCTLDGNITIGENTRIYNNVSIINRVIIGKNCDIESNVNIGHDGFAFTENEHHEKPMIKHYGGVKIGDDVHIGGQCHIARGTIDDTVIEDGVRMDTLIHIAHNCRIGKNSVILAGSLIYGSVTLEENVQVSSAIIRNQIRMKKNSFAGIGSVVLKDVEENTTVIGIPAKPMNNK